tara:strand:- start:578 stop:1180 length:603 start_codon:yes stop_codon:yes gene_type:complete
MESNQNKLIKTKQQKISLEILSLGHISSNYLGWVNNPVLTKYLEIGDVKLTKNDLENYILNSPKDGRRNYAIMTSESKHHIGNGSIYNINTQDNSYEIGHLLGDENFSSGLCHSMAMFELHKIALLELGLEKCCGVVHKENVEMRLNNKFFGYKEIGPVKHYLQKTNKYFDGIKLELHKEDWLIRAAILSKKHPDFFQIT